MHFWAIVWQNIFSVGNKVKVVGLHWMHLFNAVNWPFLRVKKVVSYFCKKAPYSVVWCLLYC